MRRHRRSIARILPPLVAALLCLPWTADAGLYLEDFTSRTFCDTVATTARWDTLAGEISLHTLPSLAATIDTPGDAAAVAVSGNYAYVADGGSGLQVLDITDPANPTLAGGWDTPGTARDVVVEDNHAFVVDADQGLRVLDVSDPANPAPAGWYDTDDAWAVAVEGDFAYIADDLMFLVVDVSDPTDPASTPMANLPIPGGRGVAVAGNYAYVVTASAPGFRVIDITDPMSPVAAASLDALPSPSGLAVDGDVAFVADETLGLVAVDISDPTAPLAGGSAVVPGGAASVVVDGDLAYVTDRSGGLAVVDIVDPLAPEILRTAALPGTPAGVAIAGDHAYATCGATGVAILQRREDVYPLLEGSRNTQDNARDVAVYGNTAFVADLESGLAIIDISDPSSLGYPSYVDTPNKAMAVAVAGDHAFVVDREYGLHVIDVPDRAIVGSCSLFTINRAVAVDGDYAFVACGDDGLAVVDVRDPTDPTLATTVATPSDAFHVAISGNLAYVACGGQGLQIFNISDPTTPLLIGGCPEAYFAQDVAVDGDYAYVAGGSEELIIVVDVSDPTNPTRIADGDGADQADNIWVSGDRAYTTDWADERLHIYDVSVPWNPTHIGSYRTSHYALGLAVAGDLAFVAVAYDGLQVIRVAQSTAVTALDTAQSLDVEPVGEDIAFASLAATTTDSLRWELSADGGAHWTEVPSDATWTELPFPGSEFLWRSTLVYEVGGGIPTCIDLRIEWWNEEFPAIDSIVDIGNDQGGQVSLSWWRSRFDAVGSDMPIFEYAVYRRIDGALGAPAASTSADGRSERTSAKRTLSSPEASAPLTPPGDWHFVTTVPACGEEHYATVAPTLVDSTVANGMHWSVFFVSALTATPGVYFDSVPDSGYSVDNLSPEMPGDFAVEYGSGENHLAWSECEAVDFECFRVYRGTDPNFAPLPDNLIHSTGDVTWTDEVEHGWQYHYRITAVDVSGNESDPAAPGSVTGVDTPTTPNRFALHQNAPNPFAPGTTIRYDVPLEGGHVRIEIFDVAGRLVRVLVERTEPPGRKQTTWDGTDERGVRVAAGIYYYRLSAPGHSEARRMMVLR